MGISPQHPAILRAVERGLIRPAGGEVRTSVLPRNCTERVFQAAVVRLAKSCDWRVYHTFDSRRSEPGFPDLVLIRNGILIFAELKSARGRLTREQVEWFALLREVAGVRSHVWYPSMWRAIIAELATGGAA